MNNWMIVLLVAVGGIIVSLFFDSGRDFWADVWEYIISFEWIYAIGEFFSDALDSVRDFESSPITNVWFWAFYACLLAGVWVLPGMMGLTDYTLGQKLLYTVIFFVVDWLIISHFQNS